VHKCLLLQAIKFSTRLNKKEVLIRELYETKEKKKQRTKMYCPFLTLFIKSYPETEIEAIFVITKTIIWLR